jgi:hypothetical protein
MAGQLPLKGSSLPHHLLREAGTASMPQACFPPSPWLDWHKYVCPVASFDVFLVIILLPSTRCSSSKSSPQCWR